MANDTATQPTSGVDALSTRLADDLLTLDKELDEVDLLITQARTEAARHEARRTSTTDKLEGLPGSADVTERLEQTAALVALTKRAALMETQVEVLEGKRRALARYRDAIVSYIDALSGVEAEGTGGADGAGDEPMPPAVARLLMGAQEDLRREIARAMHDGPAQSLTNIVLQAQIVERLVGKDPEASAGRGAAAGRRWSSRRSTRRRRSSSTSGRWCSTTSASSRRSGARRGSAAAGPASRSSSNRWGRTGGCRWISRADCSGCSTRPSRATSAPDRTSISMKLDWGDRLTADVVATRAVAAESTVPTDIAIPTEEAGKDLPPALAALVEDRRTAKREAAAAAVRASIVVLPAATWREIQDRAASVGVEAELLADGGHLHLATDLPAARGDRLRRPAHEPA